MQLIMHRTALSCTLVVLSYVGLTQHPASMFLTEAHSLQSDVSLQTIYALQQPGPWKHSIGIVTLIIIADRSLSSVGLL